MMYEIQAVTRLLELVDLAVWGMVFADPAASGSFGIEEMLRSLTCGHRRMICPHHPDCEPGKVGSDAEFPTALVAMTYH